VSCFFTETFGATAVEYALLAGLISLAIIAGLGSLGSQMTALYVRIVSAMP
jgi:Flp pilus assembly pilin Flp